MNLHPESLLERCDTLSDAEAADLRAHARACTTCRLELDVHEELRAERAAPLDAVAMAAWVEKTLETLEPILAPESPARVAAVRAPSRRHRIILLAAALLALATVAAAFRGRRTTPGTPVVEPQSGVEPARAAATSEMVSVTPDDLPSAPPLATPLPVGSFAPKVHPVASAEPHVTADTLFAHANRARREGAPSDAIAMYRELVRTHPDSPQAAASLISLGKLLLDRGETADALRQFDAYLQRSLGTELREEAMMLRATSLGKLGRDAEERQAWESFLADYPSSLYAPRARARLAEPR